MKSLLAVLTVLVGMIELTAIYDSIFPVPSEEIEASMVDTWAPAVLVHRILRTVVGAIAVFGLIWFFGADSHRGLALGLFFFCLVSLGHLMVNHHQLSKRVSKAWTTES